MSTTQPTIKMWHNATDSHVKRTFALTQSSSATTVRFANRKEAKISSLSDPEVRALDRRPEWQDREYREAYMEAAIEQGVAWQIRINRQKRGLSQKALASAIGTQQSAVSRLEDPEYGGHSIDTLMQIAKAFDCALAVKFISYSQLATEAERLTEGEQYACPFYLESESDHV